MFSASRVLSNTPNKKLNLKCIQECMRHEVLARFSPLRLRHSYFITVAAVPMERAMNIHLYLAHPQYRRIRSNHKFECIQNPRVRHGQRGERAKEKGRNDFQTGFSPVTTYTVTFKYKFHILAFDLGTDDLKIPSTWRSVSIVYSNYPILKYTILCSSIYTEACIIREYPEIT